MTEVDALKLWGSLMRLARRASMLATEEQRMGRISDPMESSILLYTDDPTTAAVFAHEPDLAVICKVSAIEGVCVVMGDKFPRASHEAERDDLELPRVAAMWFPAPGSKCPRCRSFTAPAGSDLCARCHGVMVSARLEKNDD